MASCRDKTYRDYLVAGEQAGLRYAVASPRGAPLGPTGSHLADRPGSSLEFMDHREYQPGDDLRRIDWSAFARSDKLTLKLYRQEVNPRVDLLVDGSRSMALEGTAKDRATLGLAALLAAAADNAGFTHATWWGGRGWRKVPNGGGPPSTWDDLDFQSDGSPATAWDSLPPPLPPRGIRIFLSDLLWLAEPLTFLTQLARQATQVVVIQGLAEADLGPDLHGNLRLEDCESGEQREVFLDAVARRRYRESLARHQQHWHRAARQAGVFLATVVAERLVDRWSLEDFVAAGILKVADR